MRDELMTDRADELRKVPDLWPLIEQNIDAALEDAIQHIKWFVMDANDYLGPSLRNAMREKYEAGEREHNRDWLNMDAWSFNREIREEIIDLVVYLAMRKTRWVLTAYGKSFSTNRDPGDETPEEDDDSFGVAV